MTPPPPPSPPSPSPAARYDGHADWYDARFAANAGGEEAAFVRHHLGGGRGGVCLDVACGTGLLSSAVAAAGWRPVGVDLSADQLRLARPRLAAAVRGDAGRLPVRTGAVGAAVVAFADTDLEDLVAVAAEVARILRPGGGRLVYLGLHPCFIGAFVNRTREADDGTLTFVPGYGDEGWAWAGSGGGTGLWARVGGHHKTLATVLGAVAGAGLAIRAVHEFAGGGVVLPRNLGLVAERP